MLTVIEQKKNSVNAQTHDEALNVSYDLKILLNKQIITPPSTENNVSR